MRAGIQNDGGGDFLNDNKQPSWHYTNRGRTLLTGAVELSAGESGVYSKRRLHRPLVELAGLTRPLTPGMRR